MSGIEYNGKNYIKICNDHQLKILSFEDNIYFLLKDIYFNMCNYTMVLKANEFNNKLSGNIEYEDRNETFTYTNVLQNNDYVSELLKWLNFIDKSDFYFEVHYDEKTKNQIKK